MKLKELEELKLLAQGEAQAASEFARAAKVIGGEPGAMQLRYLHTLVNISSEQNSTVCFSKLLTLAHEESFVCQILFPLPMELLRGLQSLPNIQHQPDPGERDGRRSYQPGPLSGSLVHFL